MGLFSMLFGDSSESQTIKVRENNSDRSHARADKYEHTGRGEHVHHSYDLDRASGSYREYHGGEKSSDRSYNK